jgi:hypothetical protein
MESIKFWYNFTDEKKQMPDFDFDLSVSDENGVHLEDVCETFIKFLKVIGYSPEKAKEYFPDELDYD